MFFQLSAMVPYLEGTFLHECMLKDYAYRVPSGTLGHAYGISMGEELKLLLRSPLLHFPPLIQRTTPLRLVLLLSCALELFRNHQTW